jgi:hypothetical protein
VSRAASKKAPAPEIPIFSDRLTEVIETVVKGGAPNAGHFCGSCYTPIDRQRMHCPHCRMAVADYRPVAKVPDEVLEMFRTLRRRESLVVNSFAYLGIFSGAFIFIAVFYFLFLLNAGLWWYIFDIVLLFVAARVLAGLLGGFVGDELGYRYSRRKLAEEWRAYAAARDAKRAAPTSTSS